VRVRTANGAIRMRARFDAALDARVVWVEYGWWQPGAAGAADGYDARSEEGANYSRLVSDRRVDSGRRLAAPALGAVRDRAAQ
jgi:hypothetical protein